jgi:hypothetical protein
LADALAGAVAWSVEVGGDEGEVSSYSDTDGIPDLYSDYGNGGSMSSLMPDGMSGMSLGLEGGGLGSMQW